MAGIIECDACFNARKSCHKQYVISAWEKINMQVKACAEQASHQAQACPTLGLLVAAVIQRHRNDFINVHTALQQRPCQPGGQKIHARIRRMGA
jgi:hypothetical protein